MKTWTSVVVIAAVSLAAVFCFGCVKDDSRGLLGIVVPVGKDRVTQSSPYIVTGVYEGSPAYDAGIRPDDVIVMIDGRAVEGLEYDYIYNNLLRGRAGTRVRIAVMRKAQKLEFDVVRGL
ncbi:MAG: PDZ domain-containing protein [Spirochaetes bacterium]|nr:PDZ domain-containing protein [Spirochaetota bacterium]